MTPKLLPLITGTRHGSRSHMTCQFKCGNACDQPVPNQSSNTEMADIVAGAIARRSVLKGSAVGAGALVIGGPGTPAAAASEGKCYATGGRVGAIVGTAAFTPVATQPSTTRCLRRRPSSSATTPTTWGSCRWTASARSS